MHSNFRQVLDFHQAFGHPIALKPTKISKKLTNLRKKLIKEEVKELLDEMDSLESNNGRDSEIIPKIAKEMCDLLYVVYGAAAVYGIDLDQAFKLVHESNMSKLDPETGKPVLRDDGKILKGSAYKEPKMNEILEHKISGVDINISTDATRSIDKDQLKKLVERFNSPKLGERPLIKK